MENITSAEALKAAIQILEIENAVNEQLLKKQFYMTYESLKPINLLRSTLFDVTSSTHLGDNILGTGAGLVSGYLSKKVVIGGSGNLFRKLFGSIMQLGITTIVARHPESVKAIGQFIFQHILPQKRKDY